MDSRMMLCEGVPVLGTWRYGLDEGREACPNLVMRSEAVFGEDVICCQQCQQELDSLRALETPTLNDGALPGDRTTI
jgi:hypothetical protein